MLPILQDVKIFQTKKNLQKGKISDSQSVTNCKWYMYFTVTKRYKMVLLEGIKECYKRSPKER